MTFTDDDLKRWLDQPHCDECGTPNREKAEIKALLARLEAAEQFIESIHAYSWNDDLYKAWRKACGKDMAGK